MSGIQAYPIVLSYGSSRYSHSFTCICSPLSTLPYCPYRYIFLRPRVPGSRPHQIKRVTHCTKQQEYPFLFLWALFMKGFKCTLYIVHVQVQAFINFLASKFQILAYTLTPTWLLYGTCACIYGLLTKCEVTMAGYWPSSFFCMFMDRERGQYPANLTEQAWSIKDLLYGFLGNFSCGRQCVIPGKQDSVILPAWVANHSAGFGSSCPLMELAI